MGLIKVKTSASTWTTHTKAFIRQSTGWTPVKKIWMYFTAGWSLIWPSSGPFPIDYPYIASTAASTTPISGGVRRIGSIVYGKNGTWDANSFTITSYSYEVYTNDTPYVGDPSETITASGTYSSAVPISLTYNAFNKKYIYFNIIANTSSAGVTGSASSKEAYSPIYIIQYPPVNISAQLSTYSPSVGSPVSWTSSWDTTDPYKPEPLRTTIKWYRNTTASITGATLVSSGSYSYTPTLSDANNYIIAQETTFNSGSDYDYGPTVGVTKTLTSSSVVISGVGQVTGLGHTGPVFNYATNNYSSTLIWSQATSANSYKVQYRVISIGGVFPATWTDYAIVNGGTTTSLLLTGLLNGYSYQFRVIGYSLSNAGGVAGAASDPFQFSIGNTPAAFNISSATKGYIGAFGTRTVAFSWDSSNYASSYEYQIEKSNDGITWSTASTSNSVPVAYSGFDTTSTSVSLGMQYAVYYRIYVRARATYNTSYTYALSSNSPFNAVGENPGNPTGISVTQASTSASIQYTATTTTGSNSLTGVQYSFDNSSWSATQTSNPFTVLGLTAGTIYTIYLRSVNADGLVSSGTSGTAFTTLPSNPTVSVSPSSGTAGSTLFTATASATGASSYLYQWRYLDQGTLWLPAPASATSPFNSTSSTYTPPASYNSIYGSGLRCYVKAVNSAGNQTSEFPSSTVTVSAGASIPSGGSVSLSGNSTPGSIITAVTSGWSGAPTSYDVYITTAYSPTIPTSSSSRVASSNGSNSTSYTITPSDAISPVNIFRAFATATNGAGTSGTVQSANTITTTSGVSAPGTPTGVSVSVSGTVTWSAGSGGTPTSYTVEWYAARNSTGTLGSPTVLGPFYYYPTGTSQLITYPSSGGNTYNYVRARVSATNSAGTSAYSAWYPGSSTYV